MLPQSHRFFQELISKTCWVLTSVFLATFAFSSQVHAQQGTYTAPVGDPQRGYELLVNKPYLPPDFHDDVFDQLWTVWPKDLRQAAEQASPSQRRAMAFSRYGLTPRPENQDLPLQYVVDSAGNWSMNCFACHGGKILGKTTPGLPNSHFALETLTADVRKVKLRTGATLSTKDLGSLIFPLGRTNGTTNAVMFGVALMTYRDEDLNIHTDRTPPAFDHHDMDAPAWWHFSRKHHIYIDGFAEKGHRGLMQFMLVEENGPEKFREWENDFRHVYAFLSSVTPPKYPFEIDSELASQGSEVFSESCAHCHGTYGADSIYPGKIIPLQEVGTDPVRLGALSAEDRDFYGKSWFGHYDQQETIDDPGGYVAPPLDGIWASAPYFHNGSVPTLAHVLHLESRPEIWKRTENGYDRSRVGLEVENFSKLPAELRRADELREYFNTSRYGKSASGHDFPNELSDPQKRAVLEYLKTL